MKKLIVVLLSFLVLVIGFVFIYKLLNPHIDYALDRGDSSNSQSNIFNYGEHFKTIVIDNTTYFETNVDNINVSYNGSDLSINDKVVKGVLEIYKYYAIYDNELVVIAYKKDNKNYILNYNLITRNEKVIDSYKDMYIDFNRGISFSDSGVVVNYSLIKNNKDVKNNKDICKIKDNDLIVNRTVEYNYDEDSIMFTKLIEIFSVNLNTYKSKYNLCNKDS